MLNIGTPELLVVLVVALLVLGPTKLPEAARQVGRAMAHLRNLSAGFQAEVRDAMQDPVQHEPAKTEPVKTEPATPPSSAGFTGPEAVDPPEPTA